MPSSLPGKVSCAGGLRRLEGTIVDISATGARLRLAAHTMKTGNLFALLPQRLTLYFCLDRTQVECRTVWCSEDHIGLQFASQFQRN